MINNLTGLLVSVVFVLFFFSTIILAEEVANDELNQIDVPVVEMEISLRDHGYTLGDLIEMRAEFTLKKGDKLDPKSIPLKGPVTAWIDLRHVNLKQQENKDGSTQITLDLIWQLFGTVLEAERIQLPAIIMHTLPVEQNEQETESLPITVPSQAIYLSPVFPELLTEEESLRPLIAPPRFDTSTPMRLAILCFIFALLLGGFYLWLQDRIRWLPRHPGAMTRLARQLRQQGTVKQDQFLTEDIRLIHAALAGCSGKSLYPNTLDFLFEYAPYLKAEQNQITDFFDDSWALFHSAQNNKNVIDVADTMAWIRRAALSERLFRHQARKVKND